MLNSKSGERRDLLFSLPTIRYPGPHSSLVFELWVRRPSLTSQPKKKTEQNHPKRNIQASKQCTTTILDLPEGLFSGAFRDEQQPMTFSSEMMQQAAGQRQTKHRFAYSQANPIG
jgi:hypothetical protein